MAVSKRSIYCCYQTSDPYNCYCKTKSYLEFLKTCHNVGTSDKYNRIEHDNLVLTTVQDIK